MEAESRRTAALPDLVAVASQDLYRRNAFRVCGLPVDANPRQVRRRQDEVRAAVRLGRPVPGRGGLLALDPAPDAAEVEDALQRLRDPVHRIVQELFWFWPQPDDPSDREAVRKYWQRHAAGHRHGGIAAHNLAVLTHAEVLEAPTAKRDHLWRETYRYWRRVRDDNACWRWLEGRVEALDDPRLRPETLVRLREQLPDALLRVHAELAVRAAGKGKNVLAQQHVALIRSSGFGTHAAQRALTAAAEPVTARLRARCDRAEVGDDPDELSYAAAAVLDEAQSDLAVVQLVLGDQHPAVVGAADEVANEVNGYAVAAANAAHHKLAATKKQLTRARRLPISPQVAGRIASNLGTLAANQIANVSRRAVDLAEAQPAHGADHAYNLLRAARPLLADLPGLPVDRTMRNNLQDEVAGATMMALTLYVKETGDLSTARKYLREIEPLAVSPKLRGILRDALREEYRSGWPDESMYPGADLMVRAGIISRRQLEMLDKAIEAGLVSDEQRRLLMGIPPSGTGRTELPAPPPHCPMCGKFDGDPRRCRVELRRADREHTQAATVDCCSYCWRETLVVSPQWTNLRELLDWFGRRLRSRRPGSAARRRADAGRALLEQYDDIARLTAGGWRVDSWRLDD